MIKHISLLIIICFSFGLQAQNQNNKKYFRHIRYNHVSPHVPILGIYPISKLEADSSSHYVFIYKNKQLVEIINHHYYTQQQHPLTTFGAYRIEFLYNNHMEIRTFYDPNGKHITNDRGVYKEIFTKDKNGFITDLNFYDLKDNHMQSNWGIAHYQWKKHKKMVVENRYNLSDSKVTISPYFKFGTTGIVYDKKGYPKANYNLDNNLKPTENATGVASYHDTYDENGNHIKYEYHDKDDKLTLNQWGFAYGVKKYDTNGNQIGRAVHSVDSTLINERIDFSNVYTKLASPISKKDSIEIKRISLGYLIALQQLKPKLMKKVMHEQLAKRTIEFDFKKKKEKIRETTYKQMLDFAESWNKSGIKFPTNPKNEITILDAYQKAASVKLISDNWYEYLHLIKINGQWKIVNLLWLYKDARKNIH